MTGSEFQQVWRAVNELREALERANEATNELTVRLEEYALRIQVLESEIAKAGLNIWLC